MSGEELRKLRDEVGLNKEIPKKYEEPILLALSFYPELKPLKIRFKLTDKHPVPYGTTPTAGSFFRSPSKRIYDITLLEEAKGPEYYALFKNISPEAQIAVIGHELVHIIQYNSLSSFQLIKMMILYFFPFYKRKIERDADNGAIKHRLGKKLYEHAVYIRNIPGYLEKRPEINRYYLKPDEILQFIFQFKEFNKKINDA
jgi:hypothetical protein